MKTSLHFSPGENLVLEPILSMLSKRAQHTITLRSLLDNWSDFVTQVEEGYQDSIYEYTNDLSVRDLIQEILDSCPQDLRNKLWEWLHSWDKKFTLVSTKSEKPLVPQRGNEEVAWWWSRIPIKLSGELKEDLTSEGLL